MYKNDLLYYCYLPNTKSEMVFGVPEELNNGLDYLYGCLYETDKPLGQALFEALALIKTVLPVDENRSVHTISDAAMYDCFVRMEFKPSYVKRLLRECVESARKEPEGVNYLYDEMKACDDFVTHFLDAGTPCEKRTFEKFCRKNARDIDRGKVVQLEVADYLDKVETLKGPKDVLDFLFRSLPLKSEEREGIQQSIAPYMDDFCKFSGFLKTWLLEHDPTSELVITYHVYKLNSLYDLFSATMVEIINENRCLKRCAYCRNIFVTGYHPDKKYCSQYCKDKWKEDRAECISRCNVLRNSLRNDYGVKPEYEEFIKDNVEAQAQMRVGTNDQKKKGKAGIQKYKAWLEWAFAKNIYGHRNSRKECGEMIPRIMIKYGKEEHLQDIVKEKEGSLRFVPSRKYIEMERELHNKGQGDLLEGKMKINHGRISVYHPATDALLYSIPQGEIIITIENVNNMPIFCLSQYGEENIAEIHGKRCIVIDPKNLDAIKSDFKDATHALVIFEPKKFIKDVHKIEEHIFIDDKIRYYDYDINPLQMYMFLATGSEETRKRAKREVTYESRYRHLLCKDIAFASQQEYRFICTDELITEPIFYPFKLTSKYVIVPIDRLYTPLDIPEGC